MRPQFVRRSGHARIARPTTSIVVAALAALALAALALAACGGDGPASRSVAPSPTPSFGVQLSPATLSIVRGQRGSVDVTVSRTGGFAGAVALAVTDAPAGVTATPDPTVVAGGATRSALTVDVAASVAAGTYSVVLTATGGAVGTQSATLLVTVAASASISLALDPASLDLARGETRTVAVFVSREVGYSGLVTLALAGVPTGVTATLDRVAVAPGQFGSTLTLTAAGDAPLGTHAVTVTGSAAGVASRSASISVIVHARPPASISVDCVDDDGFFWTVQGDGWTWGVRVWRSLGYDERVDVWIDGVPPDVTVTIGPASTNGFATTFPVTFTATKNAALGDWKITVRARGDGVSDAVATCRLVVFPPA